MSTKLKYGIKETAYTITLLVLFAISIQAATFTVTKIADTDDGVCNSDCSLREAIDEANTATTDDIIEFASPLFDTAQTITLGGNELQIRDRGSLTINGAGTKLLTIDGNLMSRVFKISDVRQTVTINDLTISNGRINSGFPVTGGGILCESCRLIINNLSIDNNRALGSGGGIAVSTKLGESFGGSLDITNSTIINNRSANGGGGGIYRFKGVVNIINTTISGNTALGTENGGGINSDILGTLTIVNSTIANNSSSNNGGGIFYANNQATILKNTIIANNTASNNGNDIRGTINSQGYNLIKDTSGATINGDTTGNITGQDPMLFPLGDNGGPTQTHAPSINSPVIDKGSAATVPFAPFGNGNSKSFDSKSNSNLANLMMPLATDQRGMMRPQDIAFIANATGGDGSDIGAFEALAPTAADISISGRVITNEKVGRGIRNTVIKISNAGGVIQTVRTNQFGNFSIKNLTVGETYIFTLHARRYQFAPKVITISDDLNKLIFTPN